MHSYFLGRNGPRKRTGNQNCGVSCDLIDLQTLVPWDKDAIVKSIEKTGRCVIVHEAPKTSGFGAEMAASVQRDASTTWKHQ